MQTPKFPIRIFSATLQGIAAAALAAGIGLSPAAALAATNGQSGPVYMHVSTQAMGSRQQVSST